MLAGLNSPLRRSYWRAWWCSERIEEAADGRLRTKLCKTRWCLVCNRIRTAIAIGKYSAALEALPDPQFVTLTRPNVPAGDLAGELRELLRVEKRIREAARGRARRTGELDPFSGLRKLECTYNPERGDFHPHIHDVAATRAQAEALVEGWLQRNPTARPAAQDVRPLTDPVEPLKYFTKLATPRPGGGRAFVPAPALDTIFRAMHGLRVWQPFGALHAATRGGPDEESDLEGRADLAPDPRGAAVLWEWAQEVADWVDFQTGATLSGYEPSRRVRALAADLEPGPEQDS